MTAQDPQGGADPGGLDDAGRLAAVRRVLLPGTRQGGLDRLTGLAARLLDAGCAQVSLLSREQVVASTSGGLSPSTLAAPRGDSLCSVTAVGSSPLVVADAARDARVMLLPPVVSGQVGAYLGVPLVDDAGHVLGALCVHTDGPRTWTPQDVGTLAELAGSVVAELELAAVTRELAEGAQRLDLALEGADIGSFDWDVESGRLLCDDRLLALLGYGRATFPQDISALESRLHPDDAERVGSALQEAVDGSGEFAEQYRITRPDGVRWVQSRARVVPGGPGPRRLVGVAYDVTEQRTGHDRLARVLASITDAFFTADVEGRLTYVNEQAERLLSRSAADLLGGDLGDALAQVLSAGARARVLQANLDGRPDVFEEQHGVGWLEVRVWPGPDGASVYLHDVSRRRGAQAERELAVVGREQAQQRAEAAGGRLALLADAATALAASLEPRQVLETLQQLVLPRLGTGLAVALTAEHAAPLFGREALPDDVRVQVVHVAHVRPELEPVMRRLAWALRLSSRDASGPGAVIGQGRTEWLPDVSSRLGDLTAQDDGVVADLRALSAASVLTVPLVSRGRRLGALTVGDPSPSAGDRALLADLAGRAAVALDNAQLYRAERLAGLTLQRSLLPRDVPELAGLDVAVRYLPGAAGAFVGGDWYQGVPVRGGMMLAMGDVMGHGMRSAARMGQLRAIVATLALEGHGPRALLDRLAGNVALLLDLELATLLVAFYDPASRTLTAASAGHPPPLLARPHGEPCFVDVVPGPPLGTFVQEHPEVVVDVPTGSTILLYTDGLVENRDEALEHGLERLRAALGGVKGSPEQVADHVLEVTGRRRGGDDDVALLVLRHAADGLGS